MKIIKRSQREVDYDRSKIFTAIKKAASDSDSKVISDEQIEGMVDRIEKKLEELRRPVHVEHVQDLCIDELYKSGFSEVGRAYEMYRYKHALARKENTIDSKVLSILEGKNESALHENSNKDALNSGVMRDYVAGEVCKDLAFKHMFPQDLVELHEKGIVWIHDADYCIMPIYNCCLVNLDDMLQNGTVINGTMIEKPKSFLTACTVASQISQGVSSSQYGGQTHSAAALVSFIDVSRQKYRKRVADEFKEAGIEVSQDQINQVAESRTRQEIKDGVQTYMYQVNSIMGSNGSTIWPL